MLDQILYPALEPYNEGYVGVSNIHKLHYSCYGNPRGKPAVVLHGGPGFASDANAARFFDPEQYHIILFDQRGCGKSKPHASLDENTTQHLVDDIEELREHLKIDKWLVFGGSWGAALALIYAEAFPHRVSEMVLRGIFLCRQKELHWLYRKGASHLFPEQYEDFSGYIPSEERGHLVRAYYNRLTSSDETVQLEAARRWVLWEIAISQMAVKQKELGKIYESDFVLAGARISSHYFINHCFLEEGQLLNNVHRLNQIPGVIVQGRYDAVCPPESAWVLHKSWGSSELVMVPDAGHSAFETGIAKELIAATNKFANE